MAFSGVRESGEGQAIGAGRHDNNFDFFRLMAAAFVIFYHSFPLTGSEQYSIFGLMGVSIFFAISGYFITQSWCSRPSVVAFVWSRILRLLPALFAVLLLTMLIIGPLVTELSLAGYFLNPGTWLYMLNVPALSPVFSLPGVFVHNPYPVEPNGSIWTLNLEARMYLAVMLLGIIGLLMKKRPVMLFTLLGALLFILSYDLGVQSGYLALIARVPSFPIAVSDFRLPLLYCVLFMGGSLMYLYRDIVVYRPSLFMGLGALWLLSGYTPYFLTATMLCLPYLVISLGFMKLPLLGRIARYGDFSYGLYIIAFPVQQTLAHFFPGIGPWGLFALSMPSTLLLAILSWTFIESKALKLKKQDPRHLLKKVARAPAIIVRSRR